jgi:hypothetical protein
MPKPDDDRRQPEPPPVRPPTLPPDFPDIPQNPSSELQPPPDPSATPDKVAGTTPAPGESELKRSRVPRQKRPAPGLDRCGANERLGWGWE